jgi:PAS domain S-box-containing protein
VSTRSALPRPVRLLVLAVAMSGAAAIAIRIPDALQWTAGGLLAFGVLTTAVALLEQFPVSIHHGSEMENFSVTDAAIAAGLILAPAGVLTLAVATGLALGQALRRRAWHKIAFNIGQFAVSVTAAELVRAALHPAVRLSVLGVGGSALGMLAFFVLNVSLVALAVSLAAGERFRDVLLGPMALNVVHFVANLAVGTGAALVWATDPVAVPLMACPLAACYVAYRAWLRERNRVAAVVARSADGIIALTEDDRVGSWNPAMERMTGVPEGQALGRTWASLFGSRRLVRSDGDVGPKDVAPFGDDRSGKWLRLTAFPSPDRWGRRRGDVVIVRDVTGELEVERLKADFLDTISHELRTPLTPLKGYLTAFAAGTIGQTERERDEYNAVMLRQVERLEQLIDMLLAVTALDADEPLVRAQPVDAAEVLEERVRACRERNRGRAVVFQPYHSRLRVSADPGRLSQAVDVLLSNAIKFSSADTPVEVTLERNGDHMVMSVKDRGCGISTAERDRIFERFERGEAAQGQGGRGMGLGLYLARRLVEAMEGTIWFESEPGRGSTFLFRLPLLAVRPADKELVPS